MVRQLGDVRADPPGLIASKLATGRAVVPRHQHNRERADCQRRVCANLASPQDSTGAKSSTDGRFYIRPANYLFVRDLAAAAELTAFSIVIAAFAYYVDEKAWDYYATKAASGPGPEAIAGGLDMVRHGTNKRRINQQSSIRHSCRCWVISVLSEAARVILLRPAR